MANSRAKIIVTVVILMLAVDSGRRECAEQFRVSGQL
jgi:hypothetical protein